MGKIKDLEIEENAVVYALINRKANFLETLTDDSILRIREEGILERLRQELRVDRKQYQINDFKRIPESVEAFTSNMINKIESYGEAQYLLQKEERRTNMRNLLSYGVTTAISISSLAIPEMLFFAIGTIIFNQIYGSSSLKDLINDLKKEKNHNEMMQRSAMSIIYDAYYRFKKT